MLPVRITITGDVGNHPSVCHLQDRSGTIMQTVTLPPIAWEALLEILGSHNALHGEYDITTIIELHNQITNQTKEMK